MFFSLPGLNIFFPQMTSSDIPPWGGGYFPKYRYTLNLWWSDRRSFYCLKEKHIWKVRLKIKVSRCFFFVYKAKTSKFRLFIFKYREWVTSSERSRNALNLFKTLMARTCHWYTLDTSKVQVKIFFLKQTKTGTKKIINVLRIQKCILLSWQNAPKINYCEKMLQNMILSQS